MSTQIAEASRAVKRGGPAPKTNGGRVLLDDLMSVEPGIRREFMRGLPPSDLTAVFSAAAREFQTPYGLYRDDALGFVEDILGENVWSTSRRILEALTRHDRIAVPSCFSSSKCVWEHDEVMLGDGRVVKASDLVDQEFTMLSWAEDGTQTVRTAAAEWNRTETVYRVTTSTGRQVVRNGQHPLWVADNERTVRSGGARGTVSRTPINAGWRHLSDVRVDDLVLVPEHVQPETTGSLPHEHAALIGYLLGDGCTTREVQFTAMPGAALDEFIECGEKIGARVAEMSCRGTARQVALRGIHGRTGAHGREARRNPALDLVRAWGMLGCSALTKRMPSVVWTAQPSDIAVVLGRLYACDGYVVNRALSATRGLQAGIYLGLTNEGLIRDVQRALLRLGIVGKARKTWTSLDGKRSETWVLVVDGTEDLQRFAERIYVPGKQEALLAAVTTAQGRRHALPWPHRNAPAGYRWDKVVAIEEMPGERTVTIEVDEAHTWVDLLVEHNSWTLSRATLWFSNVHPVGTARVVTLAPLWRQVSGIMWGAEIRGAHSRAGLPGQVGDVTYKIKNAQGTFLRVAEGIVGNPRSEASVQGIHAPNVLVLVDEAGDIPYNVGRNLNALLTAEGTQMVAIGNPPADDEGTWFEDLCTQQGGVLVIPISALTTPNLTGERVKRCRSCPDGIPAHTIAKHLVKRKFVEDIAREYGTDSAYYQAKVLARFPKGGSNRIIPSLWVDEAVKAVEPVADGQGWLRLCDLGLRDETASWVVQRGAWVRLGVDVAADGGDELVVARAVGNLGTVEKVSSGQANANPHDVAGMILGEIQRAERLRATLGTAARVRVKIDAIGIGWGVAGILRAWGSEGLHNAEIIATVVSEATGRDPEPHQMQPYNKRAEMWIGMRHLLQPGADGEPGLLRLRVDTKTAAQLSAPTYGTTSAGKTKIEGKDKIKARGLSSPDRGEGLMLAFYEPKVDEDDDGATLLV